MSILTSLFAGWCRFLAAFDPNDHQTLLEGMCDTYRAEARAVAQYTQHAHRMYYPNFVRGCCGLPLKHRRRFHGCRRRSSPWAGTSLSSLTLPQGGTTVGSVYA